MKFRITSLACLVLTLATLSLGCGNNDNGFGGGNNGSVSWTDGGTFFSGAFGWDPAGVAQTALVSGTSCDDLESSVDIINGFSQDPCALESNDDGTPFTGTIAGTVCNSTADTQTQHTVTCANGRITDTTQEVEGGLPYIVVLNIGADDSLSVIDTVTNTVLATIPLSGQPRDIAITSDNLTAYVIVASAVLVIDLVAFEEVDSFPVGSNCLSLALTPDDQTLYVPDNSNGDVYVVDVVSQSVVDTIPGLLSFGGSGAIVTQNGAKAYFTDNGNMAIGVVNTATNTALPSVPVLSGAQSGFALSSDGATLYASGLGPSYIHVIATATDTVTSDIPVLDYPRAIALSPDESVLAVSNNLTNDFYFVNTATEAVTPIAIGSGSYGVAFSQNGATAYVAAQTLDQVIPVNVATGIPGTPIDVGDVPRNIVAYH